jgi:hypothetical protein
VTSRLPGLEVVVDGRHLSSIAPWGDLAWSNRWPRGCNDASWGIALPRGARHPLLRRGAFVQLMQGPVCRWCGQLGEPNWPDGQFSAYGLARAAGGFVAVDGSINSTTTPTVAAAYAISAGWPVTVDSSVPATALTTTTDQLLMVDQLLDAWADETGQRWTVRADAVLRFEDDPVVPTWELRPAVADLSTAEDNYASTVVVVYVNLTGTYSKLVVSDDDAIAAHGTWQKPVDFTAYGRMDATTAGNIADGLLAKGRSELGWANGLTVTPSELMTIGGKPAAVNRVRAGQLVRVHARAGSLPGTAGRTYRDLVIEEDTHQNRSEEVGLKFLGTVARTDDEVVRELFAAIGRTSAA